MTELDWAAARRRRGSPARIAAAVALHALVLTALTLAVDRVSLPAAVRERTTTLVSVTLQPAPPPRPAIPLPLPRPPAGARARTPAQASTTRPAAPPAAVPAPAREDAAATLVLPPVASPLSPPVAAASAALPDLKFLDAAATRRAIRAAARGDDATLAQRGNALTHEESGSELLAADGSHAGALRNLPPPPPAAALAHGIAAAHKGDCMKGEYAGGGMGLLSVPFLVAAEAMGKCAAK